MTTNRMEAFSDGILAIIITIMVFKLKTPESIDFESVKELGPTLFAYVLSYLYVSIYWVNHHHLVTRLNRVSGLVLLENLHWLFWMTLIPTATEWLGQNPYEKIPTLVYGVILFLCSISYNVLQFEIVKVSGPSSLLAKRIGRDVKGKLSMALNAVGVAFAMFIPIISYIIFVGIALVWIVPDPRLEKNFEE